MGLAPWVRIPNLAKILGELNGNSSLINKGLSHSSTRYTVSIPLVLIMAYIWLMAYVGYVTMGNPGIKGLYGHENPVGQNTVRIGTKIPKVRGHRGSTRFKVPEVRLRERKRFPTSCAR